MGSKAQAESSRNQAAYMKAKGIKRRTGRCPICNHMTSIPMDGHFLTCKGPRRKA